MAPEHVSWKRIFGSLKSRLRWSYALVSIIPLILLGLVLTMTSLQTQRMNIGDAQQTSADWVAREIRSSLSAVDNELLRLGDLAGPSESSLDVQRAIFNLRASNPDIVDLAVLDQEGRERFHVSQLRVFFEDELIDRGSDSLVQYVLRTGRVAQGPIRRRGDGFLYYPSYAPIFGPGGSLVGAIRAEVSANRLLRTLREAPVADGSYAYLTDALGAVLLDSDQTRVPVPPPQLRTLLQGDETVRDYMNGARQEVIGAWTRVAVQPDSWWVVVEIPQAIAEAQVRQSSLLLILQIALVVATTIGWGLYQARNILRPIQELQLGAKTIGSGDLHSRIPVHSDDEIGELAREFNRMAERLEISQAEIARQNEHLRHGLALARDIQLGLLPTSPPSDARQMAIHARSIPAYEVGGDFYTYITLDDHRLAVAIGDISGKGVGAALMMALASSTVEAHGRASAAPHELLETLNAQLSARLKANRMNAALLYAVIDLRNQRLTTSNAGMITPFIVRESGVEAVEVYGLPLGAMAAARYGDATVELQPGDLIVLVSDGIVEAHGPNGELFGFERLEQLLYERRSISPDKLMNEVIDQVCRFMGTTEQHDDMTVVVIQPSLGPQAVEETHREIEEIAA